MRATKRQFESLESRRMMVADADTVIELWPGPMHSDPYFIRTLDDGRLVFEAATPDGLAYFITDGTSEGTQPFDINDLPPIEEPEPDPVISQGIQIVGDNVAILIGSYTDGDFQWYYESAEFYFETGLESGAPILEQHGMVGDQMLVHFTDDTNSSTNTSQWYLASGHYSTWTTLDDPYLLEEPEPEAGGFCDCIVTTTGDAIFILRYRGEGMDIISSDGAVNVVTPLFDSGYRITDSAVYVATPTEAAKLTTTGYEKLFDVSGFEFPTTITGVSEYDGDILFGITDPVYGPRAAGVDGTVAALPIFPSDQPAFGPYEVYGIRGLTDGYRILVEGDFSRTAWITVEGQTPKMAFTEFVDFDHGRELVIREIRPGDANLDGFFDSSDLVALMALGEYEDDIVGNSHHLTGDFNGDGEFNSSDLVEALALGWYR